MVILQLQKYTFQQVEMALVSTVKYIYNCANMMNEFTHFQIIHELCFLYTQNNIQNYDIEDRSKNKLNNPM